MIPKARIISQKRVPSTTNHLCAVAWSGKGKDTSCEFIIDMKYLGHKNLKIVDLNSVARKEGWFYSIPNDDRKMMFRGRRMYPRWKPTGFPHEVICVLGKKIVDYKWLPKNVRIVTLDKNDIVGYDLIPFIADTEPAKGLCSVAQYLFGEKRMNIDDFQGFIVI